MSQFFKRCVYMAVLICIAAMFSFIFSFAGVNCLWFYLFFLIIGIFLGGFKTLWLAVLCLAANAYLKGDVFLYLQAGVFLAFLCLYKNRFAVWFALLASYLSGVLLMGLYFYFAGENVFFALEMWNIYLIDAIFAMPFVYALIRGGIIPRRLKRKNKIL